MALVFYTILAQQQVSSNMMMPYNGTEIIAYCTYPQNEQPIPDNTVAGTQSQLNISEPYNILDVDVVLTTTHPWVGDLKYALRHQGRETVLFDRPGVPASPFGCSGDNLQGLVIDDEGTDGTVESSCTDNAPAYPIGAHVLGGDPAGQDTLAVFDGMSTQLEWTLQVTDLAEGESGTLRDWCLHFTVPVGGTATTTPNPTQSPIPPPGSTATPSPTRTATRTPAHTYTPTALPTLTNTPPPGATLTATLPPTATRIPPTPTATEHLYLPLIQRFY